MISEVVVHCLDVLHNVLHRDELIRIFGMFDHLNRIIIIEGCDRRLQQIFALRKRQVAKAVSWVPLLALPAHLRVEVNQFLIVTKVAHAHLYRLKSLCHAGRHHKLFVLTEQVSLRHDGILITQISHLNLLFLI